MSRRCGPNKDGGTVAQACVISRRRTAHRSPGFTLIELVVVISLILLLVGLTMSVGLAVRSQSETRQTENVLILLDHAVKQWQIAADRQLSWGMNDTPPDVVYDVQGHIDESSSPSPGKQLEDLLRRISTNQSARDILAQIDNDFLQQEKEDNATFLKLVDPWGSPVCLIHPGRVSDPVNFGDVPDEADIDGTVRTDHENQFGIALNRALLFLSAGPDGKFGDLEAQTDSPEFQATQDNVYSYKPGSDQ